MPAYTQFMKYRKAKKDYKALKPKQKKEVNNIVKRTVGRNIEPKYALQNLAGRAINAPAGVGNGTFFISLTDNIPQGNADVNNRIGDLLTMKKLYVRMQAQLSPALALGADNTVFLRLMVFQWHDVFDTTGVNGNPLLALFPMTNILQFGGGGANPEINSHYKHDRRNQYKILYDKQWQMVSAGNAAPTAGNTSVLKSIVKTISLKKAQKRVQYINGSQTQARNHLFLICFSNNNNSGGNPNGYLSTKLIYKDA